MSSLSYPKLCLLHCNKMLKCEEPSQNDECFGEKLYSIRQKLGKPEVSNSETVAEFLCDYFGYRGGNFTYFRVQDKNRKIWEDDRPLKKAADHLFSPTWMYQDREKFGPLFNIIRLIFQEGEPDEILFIPNNPPSNHKVNPLIFPRPLNFEKKRECILMSDGEVSYRCLQYLWRSSSKDDNFMDFLKHWMRMLGLITMNYNKLIPTLRLYRMFLWFEIHDKTLTHEGNNILANPCYQEYKNKLNNIFYKTDDPHSVSSLDERSFTGLLSYLEERLKHETKIEVPIGINILGHLALRIVSLPTRRHPVSIPPTLSKWLEELKYNKHLKHLDKNCTDRSIIIIPVAVDSEGSFRAYYLGSHVNLSPNIQALSSDQDFDSARNPFNHLMRSVEFLGSIFLSGAMVENEVSKERFESSNTLLFTFGHHLSSTFKESGLSEIGYDAQQLKRLRKKDIIIMASRLKIVWSLAEMARLAKMNGELLQNWFDKETYGLSFKEKLVHNSIDENELRKTVLQTILAFIRSRFNPSRPIKPEPKVKFECQVKEGGENLWKIVEWKESLSIPVLPPFRKDHVGMAGSGVVSLGLAELVRNACLYLESKGSQLTLPGSPLRLRIEFKSSHENPFSVSVLIYEPVIGIQGSRENDSDLESRTLNEIKILEKRFLSNQQGTITETKGFQRTNYTDTLPEGKCWAVAEWNYNWHNIIWSQ